MKKISTFAAALALAVLTAGVMAPVQAGPAGLGAAASHSGATGHAGAAAAHLVPAHFRGRRFGFRRGFRGRRFGVRRGFRFRRYGYRGRRFGFRRNFGHRRFGFRRFRSFRH